MQSATTLAWRSGAERFRSGWIDARRDLSIAWLCSGAGRDITESAIAWIVEFKSGKVIRVREYLDQGSPRAVGLRE